LLFICHNVFPHEQGKLSRIILPLILKLTLHPGDGFIVHSQADEEILGRHFTKAKIQVSPHPTYAALGCARNSALPGRLPRDRPLLLFCGFVRPYKGLDILLEAMPLVLARRVVHLLVAGEFWNGKATYQEQIDRLSIGKAVTIVNDYLPNEVLTACITRASVVVLPYRQATQSGIIQLAFGLTKPVITTDVGGLPEVVEHGRTGLIVPPDDPAALAQAIETFFEQDLGQAMTREIESRQDRFAWSHLVEQLEHLVGD
jgi:glycosyltransferase involved in cell wall biosynthesis